MNNSRIGMYEVSPATRNQVKLVTKKGFPVIIPTHIYRRCNNIIFWFSKYIKIQKLVELDLLGTVEITFLKIIPNICSSLNILCCLVCQYCTCPSPFIYSLHLLFNLLSCVIPTSLLRFSREATPSCSVFPS